MRSRKGLDDATGCFAGATIAYGVVVLALWVGIIYVAIHFIGKLW